MLPIYLGPILLFLFGWPLIKRLLAVGARHRVTSIADYIGARYGKRQSLAVLVTLVATAAVSALYRPAIQGPGPGLGDCRWLRGGGRSHWR